MSYIIDIDNDLADFSEEVEFRLLTINNSMVLKDSHAINEWIEDQFDDPLLLLNAKPIKEKWYEVNQQSCFQETVGLTSFDVRVAKKWADSWELCFDKIILKESYNGD
jgi:glutathione S-transferase